jgi:quercetin dioxygenase-like cupin family protein
MGARGDGWTISSLDELGDGPGFRKVRRELGVEAFGVNAIVMPAGIESGFHYHDVQDELYFVHSGQIEIELGDGTKHELGPGGLAHITAPVHRKVRNVGDEDAVYLIVGAKDGYVGRDGRAPEGDSRIRQS